MKHCQHMSQLISESQDRPLKPSEKMEMMMHIAICPACRRYRQQLHSLRNQIKLLKNKRPY